MGLRLHVLYLGKMEFPKFRLVDWKDENEMVVSPAVSLLIQHPTLGNILYDTGNSEHFAALYSEEMLHNYPVTECITIEEALAEKGLKSHFVGTKAIQNVIVSEADLKEAYFSVMTGNPGAYTRALFDVEGIQFKPIHETTKLADDLTLFIQKSHTPGVIGLILHTENHGNIIATSDTIYTAQSYREQLPPGGTINKTTDEFFENIHRIQALEKEYNATLLFGHDIDQITDWAKKSPID